MPILEKLRASMHVGSLDIKEKLKIELTFKERNFIIYFVEPLSEMNLQEIKNIFYPFISDDYRLVKMNYIYIKSIYLDSCKLLKFTLYNPLSTSVFTLMINHLTFKKMNIFANSIPSFNYLNSMVLEIKKRQTVQIQKNIDNFIKVIYLFYHFRDSQRIYNNIINALFLKAFNYGMIYFNKYMKEFNLSQEKLNLVPKDIIKKINKSLNDITTEINGPLPFGGNSSSDPEANLKNKIKDLEDGVNIELGFDSLKENDLFENYPAFLKFPSEIKKRTSFLAETTINLIYKLFNLNQDDLNGKYNEINNTVNGIIINRNALLLKQSNNYVIYNNKEQSYIEDRKAKIEYENKINKWFEYCKKFHSFIPNNSNDNIINNSSEIIQRKFFELLFKTFFSDDIITIKTEKNKTLSSDEFHEILRILRRMKRILFTEKNQNLFSELEFLNEGRSTMDINNLIESQPIFI